MHVGAAEGRRDLYAAVSEVFGGLRGAAGVFRFVVLPPGVARGSVLSKLLRGILEAQGEDAPSPRVIAFAEDAATADTLVTPLRAALWEEYRIGLVLPDGEHPTKILEVRRAARAGHAAPCLDHGN